MPSEQCVKKSSIDRGFSRQPLQHPNENITAPEDATQVDLVPELPPSGGYENFVTVMDVFSATYLHTQHQIGTPRHLLKL